MSNRLLGSLAGACLALALFPFLPWLVTRIFDRFEPTTLSALVWTVPVALALTAVTLVIHGLLLNEYLYDLLGADDDDFDAWDDELDEVERIPATAGVATAAGPAATAVEGEEERKGKYAVRERTPANGKEKDGKPKKKKGKVGRVVSRQGGRAKNLGRGMARRKANRAIRGAVRMPRF